MAKKGIAVDSWSERMHQQFSSAHFRAAGLTYDTAVEAGEVVPYDAGLLRARVFLKHDENKAVAFLIAQPPRGNAQRYRGEWEMLLGTGYARMRDFEQADMHFEQAGELLKTTRDRAQLAYHLARRWLLEGKTDEASRQADEMSCDTSESTAIARELLRSFILSHEERYREEAESLMRAIQLIDKHRDEHLEEWFHAVQNLALLGRELAFGEAAELARKEVDADVDWPEDLAIQRFQTLKAVGWSCALQGDVLGCFRYLRAAERATPSAAFEAIVLLDRAYFARVVGEENWALNEIAKAESVAEHVDWNAYSGEERIGLLLLAEALAQIEPEKARFYLARYRGLDRIRSPLHLFAFDHRIEAYASYAEGVVKTASDDAGAEEALRKAWVIFDRISYDWRAARAALRLFDVTKRERWRHLAEDKLEAYPRSWLTQRAREVKPREPRIKLPPMQLKVFTMLCQKMSTAEIAQSLGLSQHTVRNHLKAVFRTYGVNNRAALIAEAARRGDLPPTN